MLFLLLVAREQTMQGKEAIKEGFRNAKVLYFRLSLGIACNI
jgi:hypothetical protein